MPSTKTIKKEFAFFVLVNLGDESYESRTGSVPQVLKVIAKLQVSLHPICTILKKSCFTT